MAFKATFEQIEKCLINTGNILSLNDITRKSGQNPTEELTEAINITIKEYQNNKNSTENHSDNNHLLVINRPKDDLAEKMSKQDLNDLKIGIKIFLSKDTIHLVTEAIEKAFTTLNVSNVDNVVIAFKPNSTETDSIDDIKTIWSILEKYVKEQKINLLGLADVEEAVFRTIYEWANVKPNIIQINLASCCVVPPTLQAFCKEHEVQLLTHSDAVDILPTTNVEELFGASLKVKWILRFLVHIKCRGVLTTKGYLISLENK